MSDNSGRSRRCSLLPRIHFQSPAEPDVSTLEPHRAKAYGGRVNTELEKSEKSLIAPVPSAPHNSKVLSFHTTEERSSLLRLTYCVFLLL